ncbi:uncharacterized protein LOC106011610 [Aplysia californica]|uniref:Uncharacterized protein LOC106011610 n=1 Tax=Aplysia californica TaxID=6500 RepID=A0ABM0ZYQ0_APLCA|nr:uncharacterized protein LOC106011610 [Aplysia californica]
MRRASALVSAVCLTYIAVVSVIQLSLLTTPTRTDNRYLAIEDASGKTTAPPAPNSRHDGEKFKINSGGRENVEEEKDRPGHALNTAAAPRRRYDSAKQFSDADVTSAASDMRHGGSIDSVLLRKLSENKRPSAESPAFSTGGSDLYQVDNPAAVAPPGGTPYVVNPGHPPPAHADTDDVVAASYIRESRVIFRPLSDLHVYAAYLDDRLAPQIYVRIFALRPSGNDTPAVVCRFPTKAAGGATQEEEEEDGEEGGGGRARGRRVISVTARAYEMCENHGKKYGGWIYSCLLPPPGVIRTPPAAVTIATVSDSGQTYDVIQAMPLKSLTPQNNTTESNEYQTAFPWDSSDKNRRDSLKKNLDFSDKNIPAGFRGRQKITRDAPNTQLQPPVSSRDERTFQNNSSNFSPPAGHTANTTTTNNNNSSNNDNNFHNNNNFNNNNNATIGVCVPPLFGDISLQRIVNFLEMCRLLQASRVFLYIHDLPKDLVVFLRHFASNHAHFLSLVQWELPKLPELWLDQSPSLASQMLWNRGQLLAVQHCLYQHMPAFDWLLFMDTDEMLVPHAAASWPDLVRQVLADAQPQVAHADSVAAISFQSAFFQQDFQTLVTNSIDYFQYLHRTRDTSSRRSKLMVRPSRAFEVGIHHLSKPIAEPFRSVAAPVSSALLHHYRKCVTGSVQGEGERIQCEILVKDVAILKYEHELTVRSRTVLQDAMEFFAGRS